MTRQELIDSMTDEQIIEMWKNEYDYYGNPETTEEQQLFYSIDYEDIQGREHELRSEAYRRLSAENFTD